MLRRILVLVMAAVLASSAARAQSEALTLADSTRATSAMFRQLFRGMPLTSEDTVGARTVIEDAFRTVMTLPESGGCAKFDHWKAVIAKRDSILLTLVRSEADSAEFQKRAAPQGPKGPCPYPG